MNRRRTIPLLAFLIALVLGAGANLARAQDCPGGSTSTSCGDGGSASGGSCDGNGGSGSSGGGGGQCEDVGGDEPTARPVQPAPTDEPLVVVEPPPASRPRARAASNNPAQTGGTRTNQGGLAETDDQLKVWASHFGTTPEEIRSWFDPYSSHDTIGGEGSGRVVRQGEEFTISNNSAIRNGAAKAGYMDVRDGNTVDVFLHSKAVRLGTTTTDAKGRFSTTVRIPQDTSLGRHFVVALAPNTRQGLVAFVYPVNVAEPDPVFAGPVTQPASSRGSGPPWLLIELVLGCAVVGGLVAFRVRRGLTAGPQH